MSKTPIVSPDAKSSKVSRSAGYLAQSSLILAKTSDPIEAEGRHMTNHQTDSLVTFGVRNIGHTLDDAMAQSLRLAADMLNARNLGRFPARPPNDAIKAIVAGLQAMTTARTALITAHDAIKQVADRPHIEWRTDGEAQTEGNGPRPTPPDPPRA